MYDNYTKGLGTTEKVKKQVKIVGESDSSSLLIPCTVLGTTCMHDQELINLLKYP